MVIYWAPIKWTPSLSNPGLLTNVNVVELYKSVKLLKEPFSIKELVGSW